jgi:hypothetical protein
VARGLAEVLHEENRRAFGVWTIGEVRKKPQKTRVGRASQVSSMSSFIGMPIDQLHGVNGRWLLQEAALILRERRFA